jgi:hypothetical protein
MKKTKNINKEKIDLQMKKIHRQKENANFRPPPPYLAELHRLLQFIVDLFNFAINLLFVQ